MREIAYSTIEVLPELRMIDSEVAKQRVFGYSVVFNQRSKTLSTWGGTPFQEEIDPLAFQGCDMSEVVCNFNHERYLCSYPTLKIGIDERGLWYDYEHDPDDPDHVSVFRKLQRGDVRGSSFAFGLPEESDVRIWEEGGMIIRRILRIKNMYDVGPVSRPAYPQTDAYTRSIDAFVKITSGVFVPASRSVGGSSAEVTGSTAEDSGTLPEVLAEAPEVLAEAPEVVSEGEFVVEEAPIDENLPEEAQQIEIDEETRALIAEFARRPIYKQLLK